MNQLIHPLIHFPIYPFTINKQQQLNLDRAKNIDDPAEFRFYSEN